MTPEDREPDAPNMFYPESHTRQFTALPTGGVPLDKALSDTMDDGDCCSQSLVVSGQQQRK